MPKSSKKFNQFMWIRILIGEEDNSRFRKGLTSVCCKSEVLSGVLSRLYWMI